MLVNMLDERKDDGWKTNLSLGVLSVSDRVANDVLEEDLEYATRLLVDQPGNTLDSTTARQSSCNHKTMTCQTPRSPNFNLRAGSTNG